MTAPTEAIITMQGCPHCTKLVSLLDTARTRGWNLTVPVIDRKDPNAKVLIRGRYVRGYPAAVIAGSVVVGPANILAALKKHHGYPA